MIRFIALAVAMAFAVVFAAPASATEIDWDWDIGSGAPHAKHRKPVKYAEQRRRHRARSSADNTKVMAYVKREDGKGESFQCADKVRGLGTQWIGTEGAMEAAKKDWMERVRYDHGESFVDMSNAQELESRCGRVSIGEIAGQVTYRCEVVARPCKPPLKEVTATKGK